MSGARSCAPIVPRSLGSTALANWAPFTVICIRAPAISVSAWPLDAFPAATPPPKRLGTRLYELDPGAMTGSGGEAAVAGQQRRVERFGERDISGVIGCQIVPLFPDARQQRIVLVAVQGKIEQIA